MDPAGNLIIGHTTERSAKIWVRGGERHRVARIRVMGEPEGGEPGPLREARAALDAADDFTAVVSIDGLLPERQYSVFADFAASDVELGRGRDLLQAYGSFRTFPPEGSPGAFSFLHGSCNLSIVNLSNAGSRALAALGLMATSGSLERPIASRRWRRIFRIADRVARWIGRLLAAGVSQRPPSAPGGTPEAQEAKPKPPGVTFVTGVFVAVDAATSHRAVRPVLPSPFRALRERLVEQGPGPRPAFMIHAGDQIYFDVPFPKREPALDAYRLAYREAFFEDPDQQQFLASCPHYMTLDDHELVDQFARDHVPASAGDRGPEAYRGPGLQSYLEYVHRRHPDRGQGRLWYEFPHGTSRFLVLDTRSDRRRSAYDMLGEEQLRYLESWLETHRRAIKFVVSSVPFLAELDSTVPKRGPSTAEDERDDKWTGQWFRGQRDRIVEFAHAREIGRLVFLVGDMHCSYHASMRIGTPERRSTLHELAGGPIHQLEFSRRDAFHADFRGATAHEKIPFRTQMRAFHGAAAGVLQITVRPEERPEVLWSVVRTRGAAIASRPLSGQIDLGGSRP
jgi:phosphodiesterase/alkaline phosphatase D-like protein